MLLKDITEFYQTGIILCISKICRNTAIAVRILSAQQKSPYSKPWST